MRCNCIKGTTMCKYHFDIVLSAQRTGVDLFVKGLKELKRDENND